MKFYLYYCWVELQQSHQTIVAVTPETTPDNYKYP
jgi:hypothetical protein